MFGVVDGSRVGDCVRTEDVAEGTDAGVVDGGDETADAMGTSFLLFIRMEVVVFSSSPTAARLADFLHSSCVRNRPTEVSKYTSD